MAETQIDARGWIFHIEGETTDSWVAIDGITEFSTDYSEGEEEAETTTFESNGHAESQPMQRGASLELTFREKRDPASGVLSAGQARLMAMARLVGDDAMCRFRFRHATEQQWELWTCWIGWGERGGELNDKTESEVTVHRSGAPTYPGLN